MAGTARKRSSEPEARSRKRRKPAAASEQSGLLDNEAGINLMFSKMDGQLLADHLAKNVSRFGSDLSPVELADLSIAASSVKDTTSWDQLRTLDKLAEFLKEYSEDPDSLGRAEAECGSPHTLVVAGAGLRAADISRALRVFQTKENKVAKLFAKHIKIEEQAKFLSNCRTGIGVGTPARMSDLIENGALSIKHLRRIVVDASHIDQKKRGVMDMKDTVIPLAQFLARKEFKERYAMEGEALDLVFF